MATSIDLAVSETFTKLLATENLTIQHKQVQHSSFDAVRRILTFPIWEDMTPEMYTAIAVSEVGHALYSPSISLDEAGARIDPTNPEVAGLYLKIVEGERVMGLQRQRYQGLRKDISTGFNQFYERDMFDIRVANLSDLPLIDRINLHFKLGFTISIPFSETERDLVEEFSTMTTFEDAIEMAKRIYNFPPPKYTREQPTNPPVEPEKDCESSSPGEDQLSDSKDDTNQDEDTQDTSDQTDADNQEDPEQGRESESHKESSGIPKERNLTESENELEGGTTSTSPQESSPPPIPGTQVAFDEGLAEYADTEAQDNVYLTLPEPKLDKIVVDYKLVLSNLERFYSPEQISVSQSKLERFLSSVRPQLNYIFQQFNLKKRAEEYQRQKIAQTGIIDPLKFHAYRYEENLFKRLTIVEKGKNHELLFFIDWSGSMREHLAALVQQLIMLCVFCKDADIPFEVYSITGKSNNNNIEFKVINGNINFNHPLSMRNYLSSRMDSVTFRKACSFLFALTQSTNTFGPEGPPEDKLWGFTPLDESIVAAMQLIKARRKPKTILNTIFLTDGEANTVSSYFDDSNLAYFNHKQERYLIIDSNTRKQYAVTKKSILTPNLFQMLRDLQDIHVLGFNIIKDLEDQQMFTPLADSLEFNKTFEHDGFLILPETFGCNELYLINSTKFNKPNHSNRILLDKFVDQIS